jgi:signal transduction histidine kinase
MSTTGTTAGPKAAKGFGWQAALILLPVLALAAACLWALQRDRQIAERDLTERAQALADEAAQRVMAGFFPEDNGNPRRPDNISSFPQTGDKTGPLPTNVFKFGINVVLSNLNPLVPTPVPLGTEGLMVAQRMLWQQWAAGEIISQGREEAWLREFMTTRPPTGFVARAEYEVAIALLAKGLTNEAVAGFERALPLARGVKTEAGLPLEQLVHLRLLELWPMEKLEIIHKEWGALRARELEASTSPEIIRHVQQSGLKIIDIVGGGLHPWLLDAFHEHPSPVSGWMADIADRRGLRPAACNREGWRVECHKLALAEACLAAWPSGETPHFFRVHTDEDYLVRRVLLFAGATNAFSAFWGLPQAVEALVIRKAMEGMKGVPSYLGFNVEIAGKVTGMKLEGKPLAISATLPLAPELRVYAVVADAAGFRAVVRQRTLWFGGVVMVAALVALVGFYTAWRAFRRQERLAEMKSNFVSSVSHELRAPIASVRLLAEGLERGKVPDPARQQEYFRLIGQECRRLTSLVENVLDFSRIEQGRKQYEFASTDVVALVHATVRLMAASADERRVRLEVRMDEAALAGCQPVWDGRAIQQALVNLVDNALKYSPAGSAVEVSLAQSRPGWLRLSVQDQGCGIAPEEHAKIFERFYRVGSELRRETQGVGIGLSIVKHIVEAHGGRVEVRSAMGQGSCFAMELPMEGKS